jgi:hypothetical protein
MHAQFSHGPLLLHQAALSFCPYFLSLPPHSHKQKTLRRSSGGEARVGRYVRPLASWLQGTTTKETHRQNRHTHTDRYFSLLSSFFSTPAAFCALLSFATLVPLAFYLFICSLRRISLLTSAA